jgi:hypothetical protein
MYDWHFRRHIGYYGIFGLGATSALLGTAYVVFVLKESVGPNAHEKYKNKQVESKGRKNGGGSGSGKLKKNAPYRVRVQFLHTFFQ